MEEVCERPYSPIYDSGISKDEYDFVCANRDVIIAIFIVATVAQIAVPVFLSLIGRCSGCRNMSTGQQSQPQLLSSDVATLQPAFKRNRSLRRYGSELLRWMSLYSQVTFWFWLAALIMLVKWVWNLMPIGVGVAMLTISSLMLGALIVFIFIDTLYSYELQYFDCIEPLSNVCQQLEQYVITEPVLTMKAECYHYDVRSYYDSGSSQWRTERRKVVSGTYTQKCDFPFWQNVSPPLNLEALRVTRKVAKINVHLEILMGDVKTFGEFSRQYSTFQTLHRHHDEHVDYDVIEETLRFKERMVACPEHVQTEAPWWMNKVCFYISSVLTLGWVYCLISWCSTNKFDYHIVKKVFVNRPSYTSDTINHSV